MHEQIVKEMLTIAKTTESMNKALKTDKNFEAPILSDLIKTNKAMGYEGMLDILRKYKSKRK